MNGNYFCQFSVERGVVGILARGSLFGFLPMRDPFRLCTHHEPRLTHCFNSSLSSLSSLFIVLFGQELLLEFALCVVLCSKHRASQLVHFT
jgi:hypothetical protein